MREIPRPKLQSQLTTKLIVLAALVFVSWVATMFVWNIVQERESTQRDASDQVSEQWSRPQTIAGPVITIPVEKTAVTTTGERVVNTTTLTLLPQDLSYQSEIGTQLLTRGVYETPVYTTTVNGVGSFDISVIDLGSSADTKVLWDKAVLSLNVSDTRGITSSFPLSFGEKEYKMLPSSEFLTLDTVGVHTPVTIDPSQATCQFSFALPLKGSQSISFIPLGENTAVTLSSDWSAPSFSGEFLPENRTVSEQGFEATWNVTSYGKNLPQYWLGSGAVDGNETLQAKAFGVSLFQEVDFYTMVDRATKYAILFISLTF